MAALERNVYRLLLRSESKTSFVAKIMLLLVPIAILGITPRIWATSIIGTIAYLAAAFTLLIKRKRSIIVGRRVWLYALILALFLTLGITLSAASSMDVIGFEKGTYFILIILPFSIAISSLCRRPEDIKYILWGYVILGSVVALLSVIFSSRQILGQGRYQWSGNLIAVSTAILLQFWIIRSKSLALPLILINLAALGIIGSRQSAAALFVAIIAILIFSVFRWRENIDSIFAVFSLLILAAVFWRVIAEMSFTLFSRISDLREGDSLEFGVRSELYGLSWRLFLEHPLFGIGIGEFVTSYTRVGLHHHNVFLEVLSESGIFGAVIFFVPIFLAAYQIIHGWIIHGGSDFKHLFILWICFLVTANISGDNRSMWIYSVLMLHFSSFPSLKGKAGWCLKYG